MNPAFTAEQTQSYPFWTRNRQFCVCSPRKVGVR